MLTDSHGDYLRVSCGSAEGNLYFNRLKDVGSRAGGVKCIWYNDTWSTPNEFKSSGGKEKNRTWKKSLLHNHLTVQSCLTKLGIITSKASTPTPSHSSDNTTEASATQPIQQTTPSRHVVNPVLAFIKAYRLKSDRDSLFRLALSRFDLSRLCGALKTLWDHCESDLEELDLSLHQRRSSESALNDLLIFRY